MISEEDFKKALPATLQRRVNTEVIDSINAKLDNPDMNEVFRDSILSHTSILQDGKFKLASYIDAVKYVSYKLGSCTNAVAFSLVFPDKMADYAARNVPDDRISTYVSIYNKSKLVNLIMEQALMPSWIINQDNFQKAINVNVQMMTDMDISPMVRQKAADSILNHLKRPETAPVLQLNINDGKQNSGINALRDSVDALVNQQRTMLEAGQTTAGEVARAPLVINQEKEDEAEL